MSEMYVMSESFSSDRDFEIVARREPVMICEACGKKWDTVAKRISIKNRKLYAFRASYTGTSFQGFLKKRESIITDGHVPLETKILDWDIRLTSVRRCHYNKIDFQVPSICFNVVSKRFVDLLNVNNLTGFFIDSLNLENEGISDNYYEFCVSGIAGFARVERGYSVISKCDLCEGMKFPIMDDHEFSISRLEWDGSDFSRFMGPFGGLLLVTKKAKNLLEASGYSGFTFSEVQIY